MKEGIPHGVFTHVQLSQQYRAGGFQVGYHGGVLVGDQVFEDGRTTGGANAFGVELVLHRDRQSVHGSSIVASGYFFLSLLGLGQGFVPAHSDVRVQLAVYLSDAVQICLSRLNRRNVTGSYQRRQFGGW